MGHARLYACSRFNDLCRLLDKSQGMKLIIAAFRTSRYSRAFGFFCFVLAGIAVLLARNADPLINPVIYTEDGQWLGLALSDGWASAFWNAKEGYLVWGNLLLLGLAYVGSNGVCGDGLVCLPQAVSVVSYAFFSTVAAVAWVATKEELPAAHRVLLWLTVLLLPLGDSANEIIGRLSNVGYMMVFLAFLLVYLKQSGRGSPLVIDISLIFCSATNPVCILVIPLLLTMSALSDDGKSYAKLLFQALRQNAFLAAGLATIATATVARGIEAPGTGITGSLEVSALVEVALARSILYPFVFPIYRHLSDSITILLSAALILGSGYIYSRLVEKDPVAKMVRLATVAFVVFWLFTLYMRQSLTQQLGDYRTTFPDRYFMGLNVFILLIVISLVSRLSQRSLPAVWEQTRDFGAAIRRTASILGVWTIAATYLLSVPWLFEGKTPRMKIAIKGVFLDRICTETAQMRDDTQYVHLPIYFEGWTMRLPSSVVHATLRRITCPDPLANFFVTDTNWENGVARHWSGFFVPNDDPFTSRFLSGHIVTFANGEQRRILHTEASGAYLNVFVDGTPLDSKTAGPPSRYTVQPPLTNPAPH